MPIDLIKSNVIKIRDEKNMISIALKRGGEILYYPFSDTLVFFYVISEGFTYLYIKNTKLEAGSLGSNLNPLKEI